MHSQPIRLLALFVAAVAAAAISTASDDAALRRAVVGTWLYEQNAGIASVAMFTTYQPDGTAIQLIKTKFVFKQAKGVWVENRWRIENGTLVLTPVRFRAHDADAKVEMTEATRSQLRFNGDQFTYQLKGKDRTETKVPRLPDDVQAMIAELSKK